MKHLIALAALVFLTACGGGGGSDEPEPCSVAIWGDSIAVGMAAELGRPYQDYTVGGTTAEGRMPDMLSTPVNVDVVVLQYGMNDLSRTTAEQHANRMAQMAAHAESSGAKVVFTGVSATVGYYDEKRVQFNALRPGIWLDVPYDRADIPDGTHPFGAYRAALVAKLRSAVDEACSR